MLHRIDVHEALLLLPRLSIYAPFAHFKLTSLYFYARFII